MIPSAASAVVATGDAAHGKELYMQSCSACHGAAGQGSYGPSLQNEASRKNLAQTIALIKTPKPPMPKLYPGSLNDRDVLDIATYVESLK
ncbi:MAG: c-type cytochrome [Vulcanimicrobiaceae bacterium]